MTRIVSAARAEAQKISHEWRIVSSKWYPSLEHMAASLREDVDGAVDRLSDPQVVMLVRVLYRLPYGRYPHSILMRVCKTVAMR